MKMVYRYAYFAFAVLVALAWIGLCSLGRATDIPATLFPLLIPRAWWHWMWRKTPNRPPRTNAQYLRHADSP